MADTVPATTSTTTTSTTTDTTSAAVTKARAWKTRGYLTKRDVNKWAREKQAQGVKNPNVTGFLERQLAKGIGLGSGVANAYSKGKYQTPREQFWGQAMQAFVPKSANIAGLRNLKLSSGQVYMGAAEQKTPYRQHWDPLGGHSSTPGSKSYSPVLTTKSLLKGSQQAV